MLLFGVGLMLGRKSLSEELLYTIFGHQYLKEIYFKIFNLNIRVIMNKYSL